MSSKSDDQLPEILRNLRAHGDGYVPPSDAYFAELAERSKLAAQRPAVVRPYRRWLSAAAAVLLLLVAGWWLADGRNDTGGLVAGETPRSSEELLADIDPEIIDAYVTEQIDEFNLELYAAAPLQD